MREFSTRTAENHYTIIFETDERKAYEQVQSLCRLLVDGKDGDAIPIEWLDTYCTDSDIGLRDNDPVAIKKLVEDWRKENAGILQRD